MSETVFQRSVRGYREWQAAGSAGQPPARVVFDDPRVTALVDPFRKLPGTVVVFPVEAVAGVDAHVSELSPTRRAQIALVSQAIGQRLLAASGIRVVEHVEGYGVPDHPHVVLMPAPRGTGIALYQKVEMPDAETLAAELDATWEITAIRGEDAAVLSRRLDILESMAILLDDPQASAASVVTGLAAFSDRVTMAT